MDVYHYRPTYVEATVLDESQAAWETYAIKEASAHASLVAGGSMYPTIWASAKADEIQRRIEAERKEGDV